MPFTKEEKAKLKAERFRAELAEVNNEYDEGEVPVQDDTNADGNGSEGFKHCCAPFGCNIGQMVNIQDPDDVEKVVCNNADCTYGVYMHKTCFQQWEDEVLTFLRSSGRARSWSEKQRRQNLWTKKGYDLAWKACSCQCAKGHLRKDLDWIPPKKLLAENEEGQHRKQRRRKKSSDKPSIGKATTLPPSSHTGSGHVRHRHASASSSENHTPPQSPVVRSDSLSSPNQSPRTSGSSLSTSCNSNHHGLENLSQQEQSKQQSGVSFEWPSSPGQFSSGDCMFSASSNSRGEQNQPVGGFGILLPGKKQLHNQEKNGQKLNSRKCHKMPDAYDATYARTLMIPFIHRIDLSTFVKLLPPQKCNPYHIKMDDDSGPDNDEVRGFIFNALTTHGVTAVVCSLCQNSLPVFDCYPLIDGTFYLTPLNHSDVTLSLVLNGRVQFLGAVCMQCLEGVKRIVCRTCKSRWDGSHHQLGTLYSYDIFAASPCCSDRVSCKKCGKPVVDPTRGTHFFSDYSQNVQCPHCGVPDFHFVKPLSSYEVLLHEFNRC
ncbi:headcase protein homolog [Asterias amurensis]|uniref:headcase protein homolog n=1 Tax=Asterias amurensis TaxID=7602 RepID=UPI003AB4C976